MVQTNNPVNPDSDVKGYRNLWLEFVVPTILSSNFWEEDLRGLLGL